MVKSIDLPGKIILTWFISGAIFTGGVLITYGLFAGAVGYHMLLYAIAGLYMAGGVLGYISGGALGMFGRPLGMKVIEAFRDQLLGSLYIILGGAVGFVAAGWIGLTFWAVWSRSFLGIFGVTMAWLGAAVVTSMALQYGWMASINMFKRTARTVNRFRVRIEFGDPTDE